MKETLTAGDIFYLPPGHTAKVTRDLKIIDFNPENEFKEEMDHMA